jgi:hypothetical protein
MDCGGSRRGDVTVNVTIDVTIDVTSPLTWKNRNEINESAMRTHTIRNASAMRSHLANA